MKQTEPRQQTHLLTYSKGTGLENAKKIYGLADLVKTFKTLVIEGNKNFRITTTIKNNNIKP